MKHESLEVIRDSWNAFRGLDQEDADVKQFKALLAAEIIKTLDHEGMTVRAAQARTGIAAADFSRIRNADFGRFTVDRLVGIINRLGARVEIKLKVRPAAHEATPLGLTSVTNIQKMSYAYKVIDFPVGKLKLVAKGSKLSAILWENDKPDRVRLGPMQEEKGNPVLAEAERQLNEYFSGKRNCFELKLEFAGTEFQRKVWEALLTIPCGETRSYREIAVQIGKPKAVRAVGAATGKNPISIIAPCHRVIGASGNLTGFAGGLGTKKLLLDLEASASAAGSSAR